MKIFISYSREPNSSRAKAYLTKALGDRVIPWDLHPITRPGIELGEAVRKTARDADYIVVIIGPDGAASPWQQLESQAVLEAVWADPQKRLISILMGDAEIPAFLRSAVPPGRGLEIVRIEHPDRDLNSTLKRVVTALVTGADLGDIARRVDLTQENRAQQKERLAYLKRAAKTFKSS